MPGYINYAWSGPMTLMYKIQQVKWVPVEQLRKIAQDF